MWEGQSLFHYLFIRTARIYVMKRLLAGATALLSKQCFALSGEANSDNKSILSFIQTYELGSYTSDQTKLGKLSEST